MRSPAKSVCPPAGSVEQAQLLDGQGHHADAVDCLVAGVHRRDVDATTQLGLRLLVGDRAPHLPAEGVGLLRDAVALGGAQAAAQLAVCEAVGLFGVPDFRTALALLQLSAGRGWQAAGAQLQVLANIDLQSWWSSPPATDHHRSPLIRSFEGFIPAPVRRWIIDKARPRLGRAMVYDAGSRQTTTHAARTNSSAVLDLLATDLVCVLVQARMAACVGVPFRHLEAMTVLHYGPGEEATEHFDFVDPNVPDYAVQLRERGQRIVTFLVYLNDDYCAGETDFPRLGFRNKGRAGQGLFFANAFAGGAPDVRTLHAGRAPTSGGKWIVSQFIKDQPAF